MVPTDGGYTAAEVVQYLDKCTERAPGCRWDFSHLDVPAPNRAGEAEGITQLFPMLSKANSNGAAPLAQPPVRTLVVPHSKPPCIDAKPEVIERAYDDSVQAPLTASEQGRD